MYWTIVACVRQHLCTAVEDNLQVFIQGAGSYNGA